MNIAYIADPHDIHNCKWINKVAEKHKVIVITSSIIPKENWLISEKVRVYTILPALFPLKSIFLILKTLKALSNILKENNIEITHSMYAYPNAFWSYLLKSKTHIITTRGSDVLVDYNQTLNSPQTLNQMVAFYFFRKLFRNSINNARYITSTSMKQQKVLSAFAKDHTRLKLIRTGVDIERFLEVHDQISAKSESDAITIFSPRSMKPIYNIELIIEAYDNLIKTAPSLHCKLKIIDDFPGTEYSDEIRKLIKTRQLQDRIEILSGQSFEEMVLHYKSADIVVMVPKSDGMPNTAIEAMLAKKPLIIGNLDYDEDIFNQNTVWKINDNTPETLSEKMKEVARCDESLKKPKVEKAFIAATKHASLNNSLQTITGLYIEALTAL